MFRSRNLKYRGAVHHEMSVDGEQRAKRCGWRGNGEGRDQIEGNENECMRRQDRVLSSQLWPVLLSLAKKLDLIKGSLLSNKELVLPLQATALVRA